MNTFLLLLNSLLRNIANIEAKDLVREYLDQQKSELDIYPIIDIPAVTVPKSQSLTQYHAH